MGKTVKDKPAIRNFVAKHGQRSGAGTHQAKGGKKAPRARQKEQVRKQMFEKFALLGDLNARRELAEMVSSDETHSYKGFITMWAKQGLTKQFNTPEERNAWVDTIVDRSIDAIEAGKIVDVGPEITAKVIPENKQQIVKDIISAMMMYQ